MASTEFGDIVNYQSEQIDNALSNGAQFISKLEALLNTDYSIDFSSGSVFASYNAGTGLYNFLQSAPTIDSSAVTFAMPAAPGSAPANFTIDTLETLALPTAPTAPTLNLPDAPDVVTRDAPTAPEVGQVDLPVTPDYELPDVPTIPEVVFPDAPSLAIPTFEETFPDAPTYLEPTTDFQFEEEEYSSDLLSEITSRLLTDLRDGTYGIDEETELLLFERQRDREQRTLQAKQEEVAKSMTARGFYFPPGRLIELTQRLHQETQDALSDLNRDITIERAELYQKAREVALRMGISIEEMLLRDHGFKQERKLNVARAVADLTFKAADLQISRYNNQIAGFKAYADAFEAQVRAQLTETEVFKTQVQAAVAKGQASRDLIDLYRAQLDGVGAVVSLYEAEMRAAQTAVDIERTKVTMFSAEVEAYLAEVRAQSQLMQRYETQIRAENIRTDIFRTELDAYRTEVGAAKTKSDVDLANLSAQLDEARLTLQAHTADIDRYKTEVSAETSRISALLDKDRTQIDLYNALMRGWQTMGQLDLGVLRESASARAESLQLRQQQVTLASNALQSETQTQLAAATAGVSFYKDLAASAAGISSALSIDEGE